MRVLELSYFELLSDISTSCTHIIIIPNVYYIITNITQKVFVLCVAISYIYMYIYDTGKLLKRVYNIIRRDTNWLI